VVELIRQKKTVEEILEFCKQHKDFSYREKTDNYLSRRYFLSMLEGFYQRGDLTINDTVYLKLEGTVVGRRGETKSKITEFLERRFRGLPTATRAELAREFNDFTWARYNMRGIQSTTFVEHVNQLIKKGKLSMQQVEFFNSCKEEKQQGGYVSISKRAKRK